MGGRNAEDDPGVGSPGLREESDSRQIRCQKLKSKHRFSKEEKSSEVFPRKASKW